MSSPRVAARPRGPAEFAGAVLEPVRDRNSGTLARGLLARDLRASHPLARFVQGPIPNREGSPTDYGSSPRVPRSAKEHARACAIKQRRSGPSGKGGRDPLLRKLSLPLGLGRKLGVFLWAPSLQAVKAVGIALAADALAGMLIERVRVGSVADPILWGVGQPPVEDRGVRPVGRAQGPSPAPLLPVPLLVEPLVQPHPLLLLPYPPRTPSHKGFYWPGRREVRVALETTAGERSGGRGAPLVVA